MCKGATFFDLITEKMVKTVLFSATFMCFLTGVFAVKPANAVVDPVEFISNIFDNTLNVKTEKIQPDMKPDSLLKLKTEKIQPDIPKLPTKKTERLLPNMGLVDDIKEVVVLNPKKYADEFSNAENIKKGVMYMTGADIIARELNKKANDTGQNSDKGENKKPNGKKSILGKKLTLGAVVNEGVFFSKGPAAVPVYGKTPFIGNPIDDLGNITGNYLNDVAPIHKVMPSISPSGGEIMNDVSSYLDDTIDIVDDTARANPDKTMDSKLIIFD